VKIEGDGEVKKDGGRKAKGQELGFQNTQMRVFVCFQRNEGKATGRKEKHEASRKLQDRRGKRQQELPS